LTSIGGSPTGSPRWSPDGRWIVFDSRFGGNADIFVVSAKGGTLRQVTTWTTKETMPSWSRDGAWIYFTSNRGGAYRVWKVPSAGGEPRNVTVGPGAEPVEDPDGKYLYYYNDESIWRVLPDGNGEEPVPELRGIGRTRAWTVTRTGIYFYQDGPESGRSIQFFNFASHKVTAIYRPDLAPVRNSPGIDVSPDGGKLLYTQTDQTIEGLQMIANFR
jgi:Tol biopolymer transport system component